MQILVTLTFHRILSQVLELVPQPDISYKLPQCSLGLKSVVENPAPSSAAFCCVSTPVFTQEMQISEAALNLLMVIPQRLVRLYSKC